MDKRDTGAETVVCRTAGGVVPDGDIEVPCLTIGAAFCDEVEALVVVFCEELVFFVVDDVPEAVAVSMGASTVKPCFSSSKASR
jgi:hypothetical protein